MTQWPPSAQEFTMLSVGELHDRAHRRIAELEDELTRVRAFVDSVDQLAAIVKPGPDQSGAAPGAASQRASKTVPERVLAALRAAGAPGMTARELTEALFGPGASRSTLEGVRKAALRLVSRGQVRREDGKTFVAAEVSA